MENLHDTLRLLEHDFTTLAKKLHQKYDPRVISAVANIAATYSALKCILDEHDHMGENSHMIYDASSHMSCIVSEIESAKHYYEKWRQTGNIHYNHMAADELRHAEFLIEQHQMSVKDSSEKAELKRLMEEHVRISALLNPNA